MGGLHHDMTEEGQKETQALVLNTQAHARHAEPDRLLPACAGLLSLNVIYRCLSVGLGGSHPFDECTLYELYERCTHASRGAPHTNTLSETLAIETKLRYNQLL